MINIYNVFFGNFHQIASMFAFYTMDKILKRFKKYFLNLLQLSMYFFNPPKKS